MSSIVPDNLTERLWRNNWLNIKKSTEMARLRQPRKLYVAFELVGTVIDSTGRPYPMAVETLNFIRSGSHYHTFVSTYVEKSYIDNFLKSFNVKCDWINANPHFQTTTKPFFDVYIDAAAGFNPNEWSYVLSTFRLSEESLSA